MKYIIIDIAIDTKDYEWPYIIFMTKLTVEHRSYTGYKEVEDSGLDLTHFLEKTGFRMLKSGSIKLNRSKFDPYAHHISFGAGDKERFYLDTDIFEYEYNITQAFKDRDPVWFIPDSEYNAYNEDMLNELPDDLKRWFLRKIKKGIETPAQELLEKTYDKYVIRKEKLISFDICDQTNKPEE